MALGAAVMMGAVSASFDYSRMTNSRASLAAAVDAAALAGAQAPKTDTSKMARQVFDANFREQEAVTSFAVTIVKNGDDEALRVEATANVKMTLAQAIGFSTAPVRAFSEVVIGNNGDLQIALVLDVTQSMDGPKITALKGAASEMVNTMFDNLKKSNQVKIAVVPFSQYVNVGMSNRNKTWIDVPKDSKKTEKVCYQTRDVKRTYNCRMQYHEWTDWTDGVSSIRSGTWEVCDYDYGPYYETCSNQTTELTWGGCVGSRNYPLNVKDENYTLNRVPGVMNVACPPELTPLTPSRPTLLTAISNLVPSGNTYIPSGLMWGWAALSAGEPFDEPAPQNAKISRYVVLMTDGANSISPTYPYHDDYNVPLADTLTSELCTNMKAAGIRIFTISFDVNSNIVKNQLRICASSPDKFFEASNSTQLSQAFKGITSQMSDLRLSR